MNDGVHKPFFWKVNAVKNVLDTGNYDWVLWTLVPSNTKQHFSSLLISSKVYLLSIIPHSDAVRPILVDSRVLFFSQSFCDFSFPSLELASLAPNLPFVILYMFWSFGLQEFHICIPSIPHFPP